VEDLDKMDIIADSPSSLSNERAAESLQVGWIFRLIFTVINVC